MKLEKTFDLYYVKTPPNCINEILSRSSEPNGEITWHTNETGIRNYEKTDSFVHLLGIFEEGRFGSLEKLKEELATKGFSKLAKKLYAEATSAKRGFIKFDAEECNFPIFFGIYELIE